MTLFNDLECDAKNTLEQALSQSSSPLIAYSGGKDSIVIAHLCRSLGVRESVCDISFTFSKQRDSVRELADFLDIDVEYKAHLDLDWLRNHKHALFSTESVVRSWFFSQRQQRTVKLAAKEKGSDLSIFGRRTEENSVPSKLYSTKAGMQCHPIREWREHHVWEYFEKYSIPVPYMYTTELGKRQGNTSFVSVNPKKWGNSVEKCWDIVEGMEDIYHRTMFDV